MSISNDIRTKVYGKDVREAIALGVEETEAIIASYNAQILNAGNSNAEIVDARGRFILLKNRLDNSDSELSGKATKTELQSIISGTPKVASLVSGMIDTTKTYVYTGNEVGYTNGNWYYYSSSAWVSGGVYQSTGIADGSVGLKQTKYLMSEGVASKNLFDKTTATNGKQVNCMNGGIDDNTATAVSDYIPVLPNTQYNLTEYGSGSDIAFYNTSKVFISGIGNGVATMTIPTNCAYARITTILEKLDTQQFEKGSVKTSYTSPYPKTKNDTNSISTEHLQNKSVTTEKIGGGAVIDSHISPNSNLVLKKIGKNKLDSRNQLNNYYVQYNDGVLAAAAGFIATDFIEILPSHNYVLSNQKTGDAIQSLDQLAFYDANKTYISGLINAGTVISTLLTTPATAKYIKITLRATHIGYYQLEDGSAMTDLEQFKFEIKADIIQKGCFDTRYFTKNALIQLGLKNIIEVKQDGTGDFTTLRQAVDSITDASTANPYEIHIHEGTYDIMNYYTSDEINNAGFIGLRRNNGVSFIGIGDADKIILKGELANTFSSDTMLRVSTLALLGTGDIKNLTITAKNLRYCVHDDYDENVVRNTENVKTLKYDGGGYAIAWGAGTHSGGEYNFKDCYFYSEKSDIPLSFHNSVGASKSSKLKFDNCEFDSGISGASIMISSMGSTQKDVLEINKCRLGGKIILQEQNTYWGVGIDFKLKGYGNNIVPIEITHTNATQQVVYDLAEETQKMYNATANTITKGTPVYLANDGVSIIPFSTNTLSLLCKGIAMEDIEMLTSGVIKTNGYVQIKNTNLTSLVIGDKIGIVNGVLAKVTSEDYIGIVTIDGFIKLI